MLLSKTRTLLRGEIVAQLRRAFAAHRMVIVSSPMGYGKSTSARQFMEKTRKKTYSFSFPADFDNADSMWTLLWQELSSQGLREAPVLRRMGFPRQSLQMMGAVDVLSAASPAILILDDYHNCADSAMDVFLETLVRYGNGNIRILLLSRTLPDMNVMEMQVKGMATLYDQTLLTFSEAEAKEYFFINGVADSDLAERAWRYCEGWAAALWLCLRNSGQAEKLPPSKDTELLLDKIVYSTYSRAEQAFLVQLSVLDHFTAGEAEALTQDRGARQRIHRIRNKNAFLTRDAARRRYQFHNIFKMFLQKRLEASPSLNTPDLYRRAAECQAARRKFMPAYRLLVKAGREEDKTRLLELLACQGGESTLDCHWQEIHAIVQAIPWRIRLKRPLGYLAYVWLCIGSGRESFDPRLVREAAKRFRAAPGIPPAMKKRLAGEIEYIRGCLAFNDYHLAAKHFVRAHELLAGPSFIIYKNASWTYSSPYVSFICHRKPGQFGLVKDLVEAHSEKLSTLTGEAGMGGHLAIVAEYHLERGEFDIAERLLDDIDELVDERENITTFLVGSFSRARLLMATGRAPEALALLRDSAPAVEKTDIFEQVVCHNLALGYILACMGRADGYPRWLMDGDVYGSPYGGVQLQSFSITDYGKILLARNHYDALAKQVEASPDGFGMFESPLSTIHVRIFQAILARRRRDSAAALDCLRRALDLSRPDGLVLTYVEYGEKILPLLRRLGRLHPGDAYIQKVIAMCERTRSPVEGSRYQKTLLTPREKKMMQLVAGGKTTPAVAQALGLAEVTVKKALSHVYAKLGVNNRAEAASRFEAMYGGKAARVSHEAGVPAGSTEKPPVRRKDAMPPPAPPEAETLLAACTPVERACLVRLSVMEDFSIDEAAALSGDAGVAVRVRDMHARGVLGHDAETDRYRFPRSFRERLETELSTADVDLCALHRMAGECCIRRGELGAAFEHLRQAGRDADLARALELFLLPEAEKSRAFHSEAVLEAVQAFPWRIRLGRPLAYLAFLWQCVAAGVGAKVVGRMLEEAETRLSKAKGRSPRIRGEVTLIRSRLQFNDMESLWNKRERAYAILKGPSSLFSSCRTWSFGSPHFSFLCLRIAGSFAGLVERAPVGERAALALGNGDFAAEAAIIEAEYYLERGDFDRAGSCLDRLERPGSGSGQVATAICARFSRARLLLVHGRAREAVQALSDLKMSVAASDRVEHTESLELALAYINAMQGLPELVPDWIRGKESSSHPKRLRRVCPLLYTVRGKTLLALGNYARLETVARTMPIRFAAQDSLLGRIHARVFESICAHHLHGMGKALDLLENALELSRPDGLALPVAEYGRSVLPMLRKLKKLRPDDTHLEHVLALAQSIRYPDRDGGREKDLLTLREQEIMRLVAGGMTNTAIGETVGIARGTVKALLGSVYAKLGATNRAQAALAFTTLYGQNGH